MSIKIVSACLAGINCRYDGQNKKNEQIIKLISQGKAVPICPEQLGGLSTPRSPAEIQDNKVINKDGQDVTNNYLKGAEEAVKLAKEINCQEAIFKNNSPMCGSTKIYDGSFTGRLIDGEGILVQMLRKEGIKISSMD